MSWSRSTSGTVAAVRAAMATWKSDVESNDQQYGASAGVTQLHGQQVDRGISATERFLETVPETHQVGITIGGHAGLKEGTREVQSDQWSVSLNAYLPVAIAQG